MTKNNTNPEDIDATDEPMYTAEKNTTSKGAKPYDFEPNVEAALSYFLLSITGIIVYYYEKKNQFIRFHAMQAILLGIAVFIGIQISVITTPILIGVILGPIVSLSSFVLWIMAMIKAYNNEEWEIPYIGKIAKDIISK